MSVPITSLRPGHRYTDRYGQTFYVTRVKDLGHGWAVYRADKSDGFYEFYATGADCKRPVFTNAPLRHTGRRARMVSTGTTHFLNAWDETFCGRYQFSDPRLTFASDGRATCRACCKAGDAALREGHQTSGGSAARRQ